MRRPVLLLLLCLALALSFKAATPGACPCCPTQPVMAPGAPPPDPLELYARLWTADPGGPDDRAWLEELAAGEDGLAYHALLTLARSGGGSAPFRQALELRHDAGVQREYALALEEENRAGEALAAWIRVLAPGEAVEALRRLEPDPVERARHLNQRRLAAEALDEVAGVEGPGASRQRALALARLNRHGEALPHFRSWLEENPVDEATRLAFAASLAAAGRSAEAEREYRALGAAGSQGLGRLLERAGRLAEAAAAYVASPDPLARWQGALILERLGRTAEALDIYRGLAAGAGRVAGDAAFRGVVLARRLGRDEGPWREFIPPASHWARRLGQVEEPLHWPAVEPAVPPALVLASRLAAAPPAGPLTPGELAYVELEIAIPRLSDPELLAVGNWYLERGDYHRAARLGMALLPRLPTRDVYALAYPLAYRELVVAAAAAFKVEPALVWAVMREESHYLPPALSWAGARGLMQVMPATGSWLAVRLGVAYTGPEDLYDPKLSVDMGAWYLGYLLDRYGGSLDPALAAYNGGEGSVRNWLQSPLYREADDFPAVVTFTETREYLTKVLNSLLIYEWLYPGFTVSAR